jgi:hypothetical protein
MGIGLPDRKILWGRAGNRCAFPDCRQELICLGASASTVVGEEAHIVAREVDGREARTRCLSRNVIAITT